MSQLKDTISQDYLGKYEVVFGEHLEASDPQLSPKLNQLVKNNMYIESILDAPNSDEGASPKKQKFSPSKAQFDVPVTTTSDIAQESSNKVEGKDAQAQPTDTMKSEPSKNVQSEAVTVPLPPPERKDGRKRKITIRQAIKDKGVFETGVEVVEHEVEFEEDENGQLQGFRQYGDGKLTKEQMKQMLMRQLN